MALLERNLIEIGDLLLDVIPGEEFIEAKIGDKTTRIKRVDLWAAVFAMSDATEQEKMMPVRQTEVMHFTKMHVVRLKKDMKAGQLMKVRCHHSVPTMVVEGLKGLLDKEKMKLQLSTPR